MGITKALLQQHANNPLVRDWIIDTSFPDDFSIEMLIVGILDSYYSAQETINLTAEQKINFVSNVQVRSLTNVSSEKPGEYEFLKTMQVNARISSTISSVSPEIKKAE